MKKIISIILAIILLTSAAFCVQAETESFVEIPETIFVEDGLAPDIQPLSSEPTLEEVIVSAWENLDTEINITSYQIHESEISSFYKKLCFENPHIFYVSNGFGYSKYTSSGYVTKIRPKYSITDKTVISDTLSQIDEETEKILMLIDDHMSDYQKIMTVHDYMVLNYEYDYTYSNYGITIMTTKTGVCMAYSYAFKHLMNELGIECGYVSSDTMNHGWNIVKVNGNWYHIDLTWDDPSQDDDYEDDKSPVSRPCQVRHTYALLSDQQIQSLASPHYDYSSGGITADSTIYDNAAWHEGIGSIVTIDNVEYKAENYQIISSNGDIICEDLDGSNDKWNIGNGYVFSTRAMYAGLAEYNGILYYNTDSAVMSYDPKTQQTKTVKNVDGACGLYIYGNTLKYCMYNTNTSLTEEAGTIKLGDTRIGGIIHKDGKAHVRVYNESEEPFIVYAYGENTPQMQKVDKSGLSHLSFDTASNQTFFFWNENMQPLIDKKIYE